MTQEKVDSILASITPGLKEDLCKDCDRAEIVLVPGDFDHSVTGEKSQKVTREKDQKSHLTPLIIQFPEDCQKQFLPFL